MNANVFCNQCHRIPSQCNCNHALKELSDEEIIEIGNAVTNLIDSNEGWIEFARAILKKASEK
jgi:hypothetical protein